MPCPCVCVCVCRSRRSVRRDACDGRRAALSAKAPYTCRAAREPRAQPRTGTRPGPVYPSESTAVRAAAPGPPPHTCCVCDMMSNNVLLVKNPSLPRTHIESTIRCRRILGDRIPGLAAGLTRGASDIGDWHPKQSERRFHAEARAYRPPQCYFSPPPLSWREYGRSPHQLPGSSEQRFAFPTAYNAANPLLRRPGTLVVLPPVVDGPRRVLDGIWVGALCEREELRKDARLANRHLREGGVI